MNHNKPTISFKKIKAATGNMYRHMVNNNTLGNNFKTYMSNPPSNWDINACVVKLGFKVSGKFDAKDGRATVSLDHKQLLHKKLQLAYYANTVTQAFFAESVAAHALVLMESKFRSADNRVISFKKSDYIETCKFISSIFKHEFPNRVDLDTARIE